MSPGGEIIGSGGKTVKNVSGYDVSKLAVGSMGSLGILCEMTFKLLPLPERLETLIFSFESFSDASAFAERIFETTLLPAGVEVMNHRAYSHLKMDGIPDLGSGGYAAAVALEGFDQAVGRMSSEITDMAKANGARRDARLKEEKHMSFWLALSDLDNCLSDQISGMIKAKLNYPVSEWKGIVESVEAAFSSENLDYTFQIHTGNGICQTGLLVDQNDSAGMDRSVEAMGTILAQCRKVDGNLVIQRAPRELKKRLKVWGEAGSDFVLMKRIKEQIDPAGVMSPGRFVGGL